MLNLKPYPIVAEATKLYAYRVLADVCRLTSTARKVEAIKVVRSLTNWGLLEAKLFVEAAAFPDVPSDPRLDIRRAWIADSQNAVANGLLPQFEGLEPPSAGSETEYAELACLCRNLYKVEGGDLTRYMVGEVVRQLCPDWPLESVATFINDAIEDRV